MSPLGIGLVIVGAGIVVVAGIRARKPWASYRSIKASEDNIARYESWRGGLRTTGPTGSSVALEFLRAKLRTDAAMAIVGALVAVAGFIVG